MEISIEDILKAKRKELKLKKEIQYSAPFTAFGILEKLMSKKQEIE